MAEKLRIEGLKKHFPTNTGLLARILRGESRQMVKAVDGVSIEIQEGEAFGLAVESGCGKTTLGKTAIRLLEPTAGKIYFEGNDITNITGEELNEYRQESQIIHQDPYQSLNPRWTVRDWVREPLKIHGIGTREEQRNRVYETVNNVGLEPAEHYLDEYPTELSGGERQRVGIARALVLNPSFLLADEPASMLDVSIRASVLELFKRLQTEMNLTSLYVSHDLSLLKHMCDRIGIMYLGELVEVGPANQIINDPQHPYTQALVSSVPRVDPKINREHVGLIGEVPDPVNVPSGCRFHPRCPEIIVPEKYDLNEESWRSIATLKQGLLRENSTISLPDPNGDTSHSERSSAFRAEYGMPEEFADADVESVMADVVSSLLDEDETDAERRLREEFVSPCEQRSPDAYEVGRNQHSRCHLHAQE